MTPRPSPKYVPSTDTISVSAVMLSISSVTGSTPAEHGLCNGTAISDSLPNCKSDSHGYANDRTTTICHHSHQNKQRFGVSTITDTISLDVSNKAAAKAKYAITQKHRQQQAEIILYSHTRKY